ncbi:mandelate racemase/muconate lactonizing enzyme family protein [Humisphaera borealis]|uniref:Mandelate racemase/muconate lactonizing enzyme family protein n=1 Tax=Humisphaera borealis TaxID=2807512 RepID=A0A7M2X2H9_9BACT|nr:mandelate racemase/muconate lactonizing enzyme family protein [Humisphaera borealis]QOV91976.1 mandelate racemase/muconate lactonizing enzyme family protein [Humisphaera borealis]
MGKPTDIRCTATELYFLPVHTRMPLKFGGEVVTYVTCARVRVTVKVADGREAEGWGETPLSVTWVWPSKLSYDARHDALKQFCQILARSWAGFAQTGHPIEVGNDFIEHELPTLLKAFNAERNAEPMPWLAALVCCSLFDIAVHDAYGRAQGVPIYQTYNSRFMSRSLADLLVPAKGSGVDFHGKFPGDFLTLKRPDTLAAWHLVGGVDPIDESELTGTEPKDGHPVLLADWIRTDGLKCLKIKLRGNDAAWDYTRTVKVGQIALAGGVDWLTADFNCMVTDPAYVNEILDRLRDEHPRLYGMLLYVEQPFPYELEVHRIDTHSVSARKPLFLDESAHDWKHVALGRELGWTGVALKTCKTQTGALLSLCWAKAHGMTLMVQDLTNPMLAQIPHVLLAAHAGTIMGVETNAMQFYPAASEIEARVHPGIYQRRNGQVDLSTITGNGFGYEVKRIGRDLPPAALSCG